MNKIGSILEDATFQRWFRIIRGISLILCFLVILVTAIRAKNMEYVYDLPAEELHQALDLEQYVTSSVDVSMGGQISSHQHWLTGACPIGTLSSEKAQEYIIEVTSTMGDVKVAFSSHAGELVLWEPTDSEHIYLDAGSYDVYCIGKNFWGNVNVSSAS